MTTKYFAASAMFCSPNADKLPDPEFSDDEKTIIIENNKLTSFTSLMLEEIVIEIRCKIYKFVKSIEDSTNNELMEIYYHSIDVITYKLLKDFKFDHSNFDEFKKRLHNSIDNSLYYLKCNIYINSSLIEEIINKVLLDSIQKAKNCFILT